MDGRKVHVLTYDDRNDVESAREAARQIEASRAVEYTVFFTIGSFATRLKYERRNRR